MVNLFTYVDEPFIHEINTLNITASFAQASNSNHTDFNELAVFPFTLPEMTSYAFCRLMSVLYFKEQILS